jgi:hypothetical protein
MTGVEPQQDIAHARHFDEVNHGHVSECVVCRSLVEIIHVQEWRVNQSAAIHDRHVALDDELEAREGVDDVRLVLEVILHGVDDRRVAVEKFRSDGRVRVDCDHVLEPRQLIEISLQLLIVLDRAKMPKFMKIRPHFRGDSKKSLNAYCVESENEFFVSYHLVA